MLRKFRNFLCSRIVLFILAACGWIAFGVTYKAGLNVTLEKKILVESMRNTNEKAFSALQDFSKCEDEKQQILVEARQFAEIAIPISMLFENGYKLIYKLEKNDMTCKSLEKEFDEDLNFKCD